MSRPTPQVPLTFRSGRHKFHFSATPDTGATVTIIGKDVLDRFDIPFDPSRTRSLFTASGERMPCEGSVKLRVHLADYADSEGVFVDALVSSALKSEILLSWHDMIEIGILPRSFPRAATVSDSETTDSLESIMEEFKEVFSDNLSTLADRTMKGSPMHIHLRDDIPIVPVKVCTATQPPINMREASDKEIQDLKAAGIIYAVTKPTRWCSRGHFVLKPGGGARLVTDFVQLNKFVKRPVHPFPSTKEILQNLSPTSRVFIVVDLKHGYYQVVLDDESSLLTTFMIPQGRHAYRRAPMGLNASGDEFCRRSDEALQGIPGTHKLVDDILIEAPDYATLFERFRAVLSGCKEHGITLSKKKVQIGSQVKFAGHIVSANGTEPDPEKIQALQDFPAPADLTGLRSFLGLANQLGAFLPDLAHSSNKMRQLLKKDTAFLWTDEIDDEFVALKKLLTSEMLVKPFNISLPTELLTDASRLNGLGYILLQREADGRRRLIRCGSCALTPTQARYATVELEALAVQWAISKCDFYLRGLQEFDVITDHRPLLGIFAKDLHELTNPRLRRLREKLVGYGMKFQWVAGKKHMIADALSRAPVFAAEQDDTSDEEGEVCMRVFTDPKMQRLFDAAAADTDYQSVVSAVKAGLNPKSLPFNHPSRAFSNVFERLSLFDSQEDTLLLLDASRLVVPAAERGNILKMLHVPHNGVVKTRKAAQALYYWPAINNDIKMMIVECAACQERLPSHAAEPLKEPEACMEPMAAVGVDLFQIAGQHWLVMIDRYSGYPFVRRLTSLDTDAVTDTLTTWFQDFGYPRSLRSDGGPQFRGKFSDWCEEKHIIHELSSAYNPESNGLAEAGVKNMKGLLSKCLLLREDFPAALAEWRSSPRADGFSPAAMFLGRNPRGLLPGRDLLPVDGHAGAAARDVSRQRGKLAHDMHTKALDALDVDDPVTIQHPVSRRWNIRGRVVGVRPSGSYEVETGDGQVFLRNRRFLRRSRTPESTDADESEPSDNAASPTPRRSERLACKRRVHFDLP